MEPENAMSLEVYQRLFDTAYHGVMAQGCQSKRLMFYRYRGSDNRKCAIGQLLTDEQMEKYLIAEGTTIGAFPIPLMNELFEGLVPNASFLYDLQRAHDGAGVIGFADNYRLEMKAVAAKWNLKVPT